MLLALKIDVDTLTAAREAVPTLVALLQRHEANATFFFSFGPDRSGRTFGKSFRIGEYQSQRRANTKAGGAHGMSRLYGTLLPAPLMASRATAAMRAVQQIGYETGFAPWDRIAWTQDVAIADEAWVKQQLDPAQAAYAQAFGAPPPCMAATGWRSNRAAFRLEQRMGLRYASDTRGDFPFLPVIEGEPVAVPQLPTTLAPLAELIGADGMSESDAVAHLLQQTAALRSGHVFTIRAAADAGKRLPALTALFAGWKEQGYRLGSLGQLFDTLDPTTLPWHSVEQRRWPAYAGTLATQAGPFP